MPPPPQVLALGGAAAAVGAVYALHRAHEKAAAAAAKADEERMHEEIKRNRERADEAKRVRAETMANLQRGKNKKRAALGDGFELANECYELKFAEELRRLGDMLHTAQAASLGSQPLFSVLPLVVCRSSARTLRDQRWTEDQR